MTTNRIKLTKPVIDSRASAERILGEIAADTHFVNKTRAILDARITEIRQEYEGQIDQAKTTIEQKSSLQQQWAEANPEEFAGKKSIEFIHGWLGFRTGTPKLKTLSGWTWDRVLSVVVKAFIRSTPEVDKQAMLNAYAAGEIDDASLRSVGVKVIQEESFFVEPKLEEAAGSVVAKA